MTAACFSERRPVDQDTETDLTAGDSTELTQRQAGHRLNGHLNGYYLTCPQVRLTAALSSSVCHSNNMTASTFNAISKRVFNNRLAHLAIFSLQV